MQVTTDDGIELHVQEMGAGSPVVMLHGLLVGNMTTWYWTAAPVLAERHRVILYDLRGHGRSGRPSSGYDVPRMSRDLGAVIDRLTEGPVTLVGHSYGAVIALMFALHHPERVNKLAMVEAPLPPSSLVELESFIGKTPDDMLSALPDVLRRVFTREGRRGTRVADAVRFLAHESTLVRDLRRAEDIPDEALRTLGCSLLAVYGTGSSCRPVGARLLRAVPGARLVELPGGHFLPLETPRALTDVLEGFIDA
jgi:pimeloyl-ACP methyl ester carboxylesterase